MEINALLANKSNYTAGRPGGISFIVMHYDGNKGATAKANCEYYQGAGREASAHYYVDEKEIWCNVKEADTAWHCGTKTKKYYHPECRNINSIGIEMCSDWDGTDYVITAKTQKNAADLAKSLMAKYGIGVDHVVRHYDVTHKVCPAPFVKHPEQWDAFKKLLVGDDEEMTQEQFNDMMGKYLAAQNAKDVSDYAKVAWDKATAAGLVNGKMPAGFLTREQFITVADRLKLMKG